jgi:RNA polymerase sigma-32 factor
MEDMISAGRVGAVIAADRYELVHESEANFNTFAIHWIKAQVVEQMFFFLGRGRFTVNSAAKKIIFRYSRVKRELTNEGAEPTLEMVAEEMGVSLNTLVSMAEVVADPDLSIDVSRDRTTSLSEVLGDDTNLLEEMCAGASVVELRAAVEELPERERYVIEERFFGGKLLDEVARDLGLTKERIRQIQVRALEHLRDALSELT